MKALDKAIEAAAAATNGELERVLQASRQPLSEELERMGLRAPVSVTPKRRRPPKAEKAQDVTPVLDAVGDAVKKNERAARS